MPLAPGSDKETISKNISEFHGGKTYARTKAKFGAKKAQKQAIAVALSEARKTAKKADGGSVGKYASPIARLRLRIGQIERDLRDSARREGVSVRDLDSPSYKSELRSLRRELKDLSGGGGGLGFDPAKGPDDKPPEYATGGGLELAEADKREKEKTEHDKYWEMYEDIKRRIEEEKRRNTPKHEVDPPKDGNQISQHVPEKFLGGFLGGMFGGGMDFAPDLGGFGGLGGGAGGDLGPDMLSFGAGSDLMAEPGIGAGLDASIDLSPADTFNDRFGDWREVGQEERTFDAFPKVEPVEIEPVASPGAAADTYPGLPEVGPEEIKPISTHELGSPTEPNLFESAPKPTEVGGSPMPSPMPVPRARPVEAPSPFRTSGGDRTQSSQFARKADLTPS